MMHRYHRHERFNRDVAASPTKQCEYENARAVERDFIADCLDFVEGRDTDGAARARAEADRLRKLAAEAKRRALCGADPLNITGHTAGKAAPKHLAADPVVHIGNISRVVPSIERLKGKNRLDRQQRLAADHYRDAFEASREQLGGSMDFSRARGGGFGPTGLAEAIVIAVQTLKGARDRVGVRNIVVIEEMVCHGRTAKECARLVYCYGPTDDVADRDEKHVGRMLREALTDLGEWWFPSAKTQRSRIYRPADSRPTEIATGPIDNSRRSYVSR